MTLYEHLKNLVVPVTTQHGRRVNIRFFTAQPLQLLGKTCVLLVYIHDSNYLFMRVRVYLKLSFLRTRQDLSTERHISGSVRAADMSSENRRRRTRNTSAISLKGMPMARCKVRLIISFCANNWVTSSVQKEPYTD